MDDYNERKDIFNFVFNGSMDERRVTSAIFDLSEPLVRDFHDLIGKVSSKDLYQQVMSNSRIVNEILDYCAEDKCDRQDMFFWMQELSEEQIKGIYDQIISGVDPAEIW